MSKSKSRMFADLMGSDGNIKSDKMATSAAKNDLSNVTSLPAAVRTQLKGDIGNTGATGAAGATGATGPQGSADTNAQVLAKVKAVDGSGSGLDADLLDGQQGSSYLRSNAADTMTGALTIDVDNVPTGALRINANQTNPDAISYFAQEIVSTLSGSNTTTGDRIQGGIYLDINSTQTGGGISDEHRAYGVYVDLDSTGTSDAVYGVFADATVTPATGANTLCAGGFFRAEDNGGAGTVSQVIGVQGYAWSDNSTSDTGILTGGYFKAGNSVDTGVIGTTTGVYGEIEIAGSTPDRYGTSYVFQAQYDNNSTVAQTNTTYLYYGNYAGVLPTTAYGVYIADAVPNVFLGTLRLGDGSTSEASYGFNGDVNTGMYSPANHELGFLANGAQRLKLNSLGADITGVMNLRATSNAGPCLINFSDNIPAVGQSGTIEYVHTDSSSYGSGNAFKVYGTEALMSFHVAGTGLFTGNVTAYYSDERLKDFEGTIPNALDKVKQLNGYYYKGNDVAATFGYDTEERQVGVSAQEVEAVLPEIVVDAAIGEGYKTVQYDKLVPLLIEAIKEQQTQIDELKALVGGA